MRHVFPYPDIEPVEIPDGNLGGVYTIAEPGGSGRSDRALVAEALARPIESPRLREKVGAGTRVAIAVDDSSRSTRTDLMLPLVLEELGQAGVADGDIRIYIALGTHRQMSPREIEGKYTPEAAARYRIVNPDWRDAGSYLSIGRSAEGFPIKIHREIVEADFVIGVGQTIPHMIAGFGGGGKIINPGCADAETIGEMHWMCRRVPEGELFAVRDNAVRSLIDEMALKAGLRFIVNEVPAGGGRLAGAFAGHPVEAHRAACAFSRSTCEVRIRDQAEIVLSDAYPADLDFWQALKGLNAAYGAVRDGGTVILVTPCPEGTSAQHPELTEVGYVPVEKTEELVHASRLDKAVAANLLLGRRLLDRAEAILVAPGISQADTTAMGFMWAPDPQTALEIALARRGPRARVNVLHKAAKMVCVS